MDTKPLEEHGCSLSYSAIGSALNLSRQTVWGWFQPGRRVPAERVPDVERVTGVPRKKLRPDIYGEPERVA